MNAAIISVESVGKRYTLGEIGAASLREVVDAWSSRVLLRLGRRSPAPPPLAGAETDGRQLWALHGVSFEVQRGEVLGIIGRNGAGKSTLLKILSRVTEPTTGRAVLRGRVASLLEVGTGFHPELSGRENIYLNGAILGMKKAEIRQKFDEIVAFAEVDRFIDTPVKRYSSGMYVRLAFAVAAHLEPEILIVDEVLAVGDASFQKKCLGRMKNVAREGRTVLFVSHNMDAMLNLCTRAVVLERGRLSFDGSAQQAIEAYLGGQEKGRNGFVDLVRHPGRPSGLSTVATGVGLRVAGESRFVNRVRTGQDVTLEVAYDTGADFVDLVQLGLCSVTGQRLSTVGTHLCPGGDVTLRGRGRISCRLPALPLAGGEYSVVVMLGKRNPFHNVDYIEHALQFQVDTADYFGTGRTLLPAQGFLAQRSEWSVTDEQPTLGPQMP